MPGVAADAALLRLLLFSLFTGRLRKQPTAGISFARYTRMIRAFCTTARRDGEAVFWLTFIDAMNIKWSVKLNTK